jgi:hypothetical protein
LQAYAFAVFADQQSALTALSATNVSAALLHTALLNNSYTECSKTIGPTSIQFSIHLASEVILSTSQVMDASNMLYQITVVLLSHFLLQGMVFDLEKNCSLHVDLAKSNSRSKRLRSGRQLPFTSGTSFLHMFLLYYVVLY